MINKTLKREVKSKLRNRVSKSDIYEELKSSENDEQLRAILAANPSFDLRNRYKSIHIVLGIIWGIFLALELIGNMSLISYFNFKDFISLVISFYITINIWKFDGRFLMPGIIWFLFTIFNAYKSLWSEFCSDPDYDLFLYITIAYSFLIIIGIFLMYYLKKKVFSYFNWLYPKREDKDLKFE